MIGRREFMAVMGAGAACMTGMAMTGMARASSAASADSAVIVLFDDRYRDSLRFAQEAARRGARVEATGQDLVRMWYAGLSHVAARADMVIAGLTTHSDFEVLQSCVRSLGLKPRLEVIHERLASRAVAHRVLRASGAGWPGALAAAGESWPTALASRVLGSAAAASGRYSAPLRPGSGRAVRGDAPVTLVTWQMS